ncbi:hypothetical protein EAY27_19220 [Vibrio anguillarum]|nr:hypothetical protein [Vibrio anguillarum]MBF4279256.1 hypothetical protein [Vibrio anguillarum]MBF4300267.1 hypothetical protein [Vibrio anguillarum]MBF4364353.1 hypothetical protein [Vibrio anguillarum]MBF4399836.1 hypothetical protein [Vibrio anguillarum]
MAREIPESSSQKLCFSFRKPNAALSGEQRRPLNSKHCAVNTETEVNQKCRTLGIRLKCFVMSALDKLHLLILKA